MKIENAVIMNAPVDLIFQTAADLSRWTGFLPHYLYVTYLQQSPTLNIVRMAARRNWIPVRWTSEQEIDYAKKEIRFRHLTSFTKEMRVVWSFKPVPGGIEVRIIHELQPTIPLIGSFIVEKIIGGFFIHYIANQTLINMKKYVETLNVEY